MDNDTHPTEASHPDDADLLTALAQLDLEERRLVRELKRRQIDREMRRRGLLPPDDAGQGKG